MTVKKNKVGQTRWTTEANVVDLVRVLARQLPDNGDRRHPEPVRKDDGTWCQTGRGLMFAVFETPMVFWFIALANAPSEARSRSTKRPKILKVSRATAYRMVDQRRASRRGSCAPARPG